MPISLSDYLGIERDALESRSAFNTILDADSRYFINFVRVRDATTDELAPAYGRLQQFFREIGVILKASSVKGDRFYREAHQRLDMRELEEVCLGYSMKGTSGSGSGAKLKEVILSTAKDILDAGIEEPEIFQLVGLFEEGIGPDRISDMIGRIIRPDLIAYSKRILDELAPVIERDIERTEEGLPLNPYNGKALLIVPRELLHELPIAAEWEDVDYVVAVNRDVRQKVNEIIGAEWRRINTTQKKKALKGILLGQPSLDRNWKCINCGFTDDISLYNDKLRKPNFVIAPILPTCNVCGCEVQLVAKEGRDYDNRVFVLTGPIGSGKTSTAEHLFSRHGFNAVDHDCIVDLASHKHNSKVEFNAPEAIAAIEDSLDTLIAFEKDIVLSLVILPPELDMYRSMLQKRKLDYRIFFLCPDYDTILQRVRTRTCFRSVTPEKWIRHFYEETKPFRNIEGEDVVLLDNTGMTVEESVETMFAQL